MLGESPSRRVGAELDTADVIYGRGEIRRLGERIRSLAEAGAVRMPHDERYVCELLVHGRARLSYYPVLSEWLAVVACENDEAVVVQAEVLQPLEEHALVAHGIPLPGLI